MKNTDFNERNNEILKYIKEKGKASVPDLSTLFNASPCTIRRVLNQMSDNKLVKRYYGGVIFNESNITEPAVNNRALFNPIEKQEIAKAAANIISNGETIILLGGTTVNAICPFLKGKNNLKVITNSIVIVNQLIPMEEIEVIFLGGVLNRKELFVTGYLTSLCIKDLHADKLFFGVRAIHQQHGLMLDDPNELEIYRSLMNAAEQNIVLADHSKFTQTGTIVLSPIDNVHKIITDDKIPQTFVKNINYKRIIQICKINTLTEERNS